MTQTILALDTATEACSVALTHLGKVTHLDELSPRTHTQRILPMIDELLAKAKELKEFLEREDTVVTIKAKAGEDGRLFGAIPAKQIAEEFNKTFNVELDRRKFELAAPIRALGYTRVPVKLHHDVQAIMTVNIVAQ